MQETEWQSTSAFNVRSVRSSLFLKFVTLKLWGQNPCNSTERMNQKFEVALHSRLGSDQIQSGDRCATHEFDIDPQLVKCFHIRTGKAPSTDVTINFATWFSNTIPLLIKQLETIEEYRPIEQSNRTSLRYYLAALGQFEYLGRHCCPVGRRKYYAHLLRYQSHKLLYKTTPWPEHICLGDSRKELNDSCWRRPMRTK